MGFSIIISLRNRLRSAMPRRQIIMQIVYRSIILMLIGLILNSHGRKSELDDLRFPGVLQRIGITYLVVGLLEAVFTKRSPNYEVNQFFYSIFSVSFQTTIVFIAVFSIFLYPRYCSNLASMVDCCVFDYSSYMFHVFTSGSWMSCRIFRTWWTSRLSSL